MNVAILIFPDVELVDMNGPLDTFNHANDFNGGKYNIYTAADGPGSIISCGGVTVTPKEDINSKTCPEPDIIVIPGIYKNGQHGVASPAVIAWLKKMAKKKKVIMSVCIGIYTLIETGLLNGKEVTTHYMAIPDLLKNYPKLKVKKNERYVQDASGYFVTTGGITSGIDGALHLVSRFDSATIAQQTADVMVYNREAPLPPYTLLPPY